MRHTKHNRLFKFAAAAAAVAVAGVMVVVSAPFASAAPRVINVSAKLDGFTSSTITVKPGEAVSICFKATDTDHDLTIADIGFKVSAPTGPAVCKNLTAPAAAGSHKFICSISGHEAAGMVGKMVVAGASAGGAPAAPAPAAPDPQVAGVPSGGAQTGGGSTAGFDNAGLVTLGGGLLVAAFISAMLGCRVARRD